jgi:hypothetical protein
MSPNPPMRSKNNLSLFIGLWLGVTVVAGLAVFALIFWAAGGFDSATPTPVPVAATAPLPTEPPATSAEAGGEAVACNYPPPPASGFGYGIQSHVFVGDNAYWLGVIADKLHLQWVKMQVRWNEMEPTEGAINWKLLNPAVHQACKKGLHVMLSVVAAPEWTHTNPMPALEGQQAPPDNNQAYADFLWKLAKHYPGQIGAIEVWNEENLEREWNTAAGIAPVDYVKLLRAAYNTVKTVDPNIIIISGALSPTGVNCRGSIQNCQPQGRQIVMDDATYLTQFVQAGGLQYVDCIGTHSNGTNLPPTADGAHPLGDGTGYTFKGPWQTPHYSWALKSQVERYEQILKGQKQQCVTEFGYASAVNGQYPPSFGFAADVSEEQQADYLVAAYDWMRASGLVKLAFLFNLDYGPKGGDPATDDNVIFSILSKDGLPRPAFDAISLMAKP